MNAATEAGRKRINWRWIFPVLLVGGVFMASGRSHVAGPDIVNIDKFAHFGVFGTIATSIVRLVPRWRGIWVVALVSGYGICDEWRQSFTVGRSVEVADWVADTLGAVVAVTAYRMWPWYRRLLETPVIRRRAKRRVEKVTAVSPVCSS